jgi:opacity protein-like surface antigen
MKSYFHFLKPSNGALIVSFLSFFIVQLLSTPVLANEIPGFLKGQPYFSVSAMVTSAGSTKLDSACCPSQIMPGDELDTAVGYGVVGAFGWLTNTNWRGEIEFGHRGLSLNSIGPSVAVGTLTMTTAFVNVARDFRGDSFITPYVGLGVGGAFHKIETESIGGAPPAWGSDQDNFALVYQAFTGLNLEVGEDIDIIVGYRFLRTTEMDFNAFELEPMNIHHFEMGLKFYVEDLFN